MASAVEAWNLNHWTVKEVPRIISLTAMISPWMGAPKQGQELLIPLFCAAWYPDGLEPEGPREDQTTKRPHGLRWGNGEEAEMPTVFFDGGAQTLWLYLI